MIPSEVREGLKENLKNISDLRIYDIMPDVVVPPSAIIGQLDFTFDLNNSRGLDQANVDIFVIVQRFSERSGIQNLDKYLSGSGNQSIKQAIESDRTLGGACNTLRVTSAESGTFTSGDVDFLSYRYRVTIWGQGE
jgi:hypothetical protein